MVYGDAKGLKRGAAPRNRFEPRASTSLIVIIVAGIGRVCTQKARSEGCASRSRIRLRRLTHFRSSFFKEIGSCLFIDVLLRRGRSAHQRYVPTGGCGPGFRKCLTK